jgi:hypothetical protein
MWQDVIALTIVAATAVLTARAAVRSARSVGGGCSDCSSCASGSDTVISADALRVFAPPGGGRSVT